MNFDRSLIGYRSIYGWTRLDIFNGPAERGRRIASASTSVRLTAWTGSLVMDRRAQGHKPAYNRRVSRLRRGCQVKFILIKLEDPEIERSFSIIFPCFWVISPLANKLSSRSASGAQPCASGLHRMRPQKLLALTLQTANHPRWRRIMVGW